MNLVRRLVSFLFVLCLLPGVSLASGLPYGFYLHDGSLSQSTLSVATPTERYVLLAGECLSAQLLYRPYEGDMAILDLGQQGDLAINASFRVNWTFKEDLPKDTALTVHSHLLAESGEQPFVPGRYYLLFGRILPGNESSQSLALGVLNAQAQQGILTLEGARWRYFSPLPNVPCWAELDQAQFNDPYRMLTDTIWHQYEVMLSLLTQCVTLVPLLGNEPPAALRLIKGSWPENEVGVATVSNVFAKQNELALGDILDGIPFPLLYQNLIRPDLGANGLVDRSISLLLLSQPGTWREAGPHQKLRIVGIYESEEHSVAKLYDANSVFVR